MDEHKLTILESYKVMLTFLDGLYKMTNSDDLAGFLGGFSISKENEESVETIDPATWYDWLNSVKFIIEKRNE